MEGSYEELTIELKSEDKKGLTRERRGGKSGLSKRPEIHREEPACGPKRNATPKFCMTFENLLDIILLERRPSKQVGNFFFPG